MDCNHILEIFFCCLILLQLSTVTPALYTPQTRPSSGYAPPKDVYAPVSNGVVPLGIHNSLHRPLNEGSYNFGSRLPIPSYAHLANVKHQDELGTIKTAAGDKGSKMFSNSQTNVNIKKEQPLTVVFNRPKPIIVLDRRPIINVVNKIEKSVGQKQGEDLVGTVGLATNLKTVNVGKLHGNAKVRGNVGQATNFKTVGGNANIGGPVGFGGNVNIGGPVGFGGNANIGGPVGFGGNVFVGGGDGFGGKVKMQTGDVNIHNKQPAGVFKRPGMVEAAMAVSSGGMGQSVDVGQSQMGGQNIDISGLLGGINSPSLPPLPIPAAPGISLADAVALSSAVARLEQKISGMQQNVNINNNNNNNNNNLNNNLNSNINGDAFDMNPMMMAMMMNADLGEAMMDAMAQKLTGGAGAGSGGAAAAGAGAGAGAGASGGGSGLNQIKISPENTTGKSVILKVDGNVHISKSNIAK